MPYIKVFIHFIWATKNREHLISNELSVSYSAINKVRAYINGQEEHHKKKTFVEEYDEFLKALQLDDIKTKTNI